MTQPHRDGSGHKQDGSVGKRTETDSLGPIEVPGGRLWGAQTQRSLENFDIGRHSYVWGRPVIEAIGAVKKAAALANLECGVLDEDRAKRIVAAAEEVIAGDLDNEFPLVVFQTGSGTHTNMNANEVIATRAFSVELVRFCVSSSFVGSHEIGTDILARMGLTLSGVEQQVPTPQGRPPR